MSDFVNNVLVVVLVLLIVGLPMVLTVVYMLKTPMVKNARYKNQPANLYSHPLLNDILRKALSASQPLIINLYIDRIVLGNESYFYAACGVPALHAKDLPTAAHWCCQALAKKAKYEIRYAYGRQTNLQRPHITLQGYIVCPEGVV